ncbi:MAG: hypothetical protein Q7S27_07270 [Nanoarchaeota archaeon]|nr:hypothetical protein [Nanoarchaeota archaeon]
MKLKEIKKKKATKKDLERITRIYWEIKNDPEAMRQVKELLADTQ